MKELILSVIYFLAGIFSTQSQTLYGTTSGGSYDRGGTIIKFTPATNNVTVAKYFENLPYRPYYTNFIQARDGKLYGMTNQGGDNATGVIFSFDPSRSIYKKLKDFDYADFPNEGSQGGNPEGSLVQASDGKLYGMTYRGGNANTGVIFSFDPSSSTYTRVKDFDNTNGAKPAGNLMQASDGKLYGMTSYGGSKDHGVIFSFDPRSSVYTKLKDFDNINGGNPMGSLVQASDGKLYGMTTYGGSNGGGVIFSFDPFSSTYTKLRDFVLISDGGNPEGNLIQGSDGKLYGMTTWGGIFSFDPSSSTFTKLKQFDDLHGDHATGSLTQASDGKLYGMTSEGGRKGYGVVFSFDPSTAIYKRLKDFGDSQGSGPLGSLVQARNGKLYGMTTYGGSEDFGVIFSIDPSSDSFKKLKDFASNEEGSHVAGSLLPALGKQLYGMTTYGGANSSGVIFSFDPSSSKYTKLKDFDSINGSYPQGNLIRAGNGKLYGITNSGGSSNAGVIFSFDPVSSTYTRLIDFNGLNGAFPYKGLVQASDGKLYGITYYGGSNGAGVIFSFDLTSSTYTKLKDFDVASGSYPTGSLMQANDGKLYGMTYAGGASNLGVIFSFDPSSSTYTKQVDFNYSNGANPYGSLVQATNGKLYGVTSKGGDPGVGTIFSFDPSSSTYKRLISLNQNARTPYGSLMQASDGKLYGVTAYWANSDFGGIFSFDPSSSAYTDLKDFDGTNGSAPNSPFIEIKDCVADTTYYRDADGDGYGNFADSIAACSKPAGYVANHRDCNDDPAKGGAAIHPGAPEVCNGIDDDCDGQIDSWTLEGEDAILNGAVIASNEPGYTGTGFADFVHPSGDYIEWTVNASAAGLFSLQFRYANGGVADRHLKLEINGIVADANMAFSPNGSWAVWSVAITNFNLPAGANKVRLTTINSQGPNIDHLTVGFIGCQPGYLEAEEAVLNGAVVAFNEPGYTGSGFADFVHTSGDYIEWTLNTPAAGSYSLQFRYANGGVATRNLKLEVNGIVVAPNLAFPPLANWAAWSVSTVNANLIAGANKVRLTTTGSQGPNIDHLAFSSNNSIKPAQERFTLAKSMLPALTGVLRAEAAPNPVEGGIAKLTIFTSSNLPVDLQLVDITGKNYKSLKVVLGGSTNFNFPVNDLAPGTYTVIVTQGNLSTHARLIIGRNN